VTYQATAPAFARNGATGRSNAARGPRHLRTPAPETLPVNTVSNHTVPNHIGPSNLEPNNIVPPTSDSPEAPATKTAKAKRGWEFWLGIAMVVGGLGLGGAWLWNIFGTTMVVNSYQQQAVAEFSATIEAALPAEIVAAAEPVIVEPELLRTDFEAFPPPVVDMDSLGLGEIFGLLTVPSWNEQRGVSDELLNNRILLKQGGFNIQQTNRILNTGAAAHYVETVGPGEVGNFSISAHRRSFGDNFLHLPSLELGDYVLVETADAWYIYRVIDRNIILPTDMSVIQPDPFSALAEDGTQTPTRRLLTMTTCTGADGSPWRNTHRYIVHAELESWMPRSEGFPPMIDHYWEEPDAL